MFIRAGAQRLTWIEIFRLKAEDIDPMTRGFITVMRLLVEATARMSGCRRWTLAPALAALIALSGPGACAHAAGPSAPDGAQARVRNGQWGGTGALLTVDDSSAAIQFDCAEGTLNGPLAIDEERRFTVEGTFVRGRGGPVGEEPPRSERATYSGQVDDDTLTLTVRVGEEDFGTFTLTRGKTARLRRCL